MSDAKRYFSRRGAPAYAIGSRFVNGRAERQEYLETAIQWIKDDGQTVEEYMAAHQHDRTATALWSHFQAVINRVEAVFPNYRKQMKSVDWGGLYGHLRDESLDPEELEAAVGRLVIDDDVTRKAGVYRYLLTGQEKHLSIRAFSDAMKQKAFEIQNGTCRSCNEQFEISEMDADHITPWFEGGKTVEESCQMLHPKAWTPWAQRFNMTRTPIPSHNLRLHHRLGISLARFPGHHASTRLRSFERRKRDRKARLHRIRSTPTLAEYVLTNPFTRPI